MMDVSTDAPAVEPAGAMQAMDIVSSSGPRMGPCRRCLRHRVVITLVTALITVAVTSTVLGVTLTKGDDALNAPDPEWPMQLTLMDGEEYEISSDHQQWTANANDTVVDPTAAQRLRNTFRVRQVCGNAQWNLLKVALQSIDISAAQFEGNPFMAQIGDLMSSTLAGHSIWTKLSVHGDVLERDADAVNTAVQYGVQKWVTNLLNSTSDPMALAVIKQLLLQMMPPVVTLFERQSEAGIYPYLQATPNVSVSLHETWAGVFPLVQGIPIPVTYRLDDMVYSAGHVPRLVLNTTATAAPTDDALTDYMWVWANGTGDNLRDVQTGFLIVSMSADFTTTDPSQFQAVVDAQAGVFGGGGEGGGEGGGGGGAPRFNVTASTLRVRMGGRFIIGTASGAVLDARVSTWAFSNTTMTISTPQLSAAPALPALAARDASHRLRALRRADVASAAEEGTVPPRARTALHGAATAMVRDALSAVLHPIAQRMHVAAAPPSALNDPVVRTDVVVVHQRDTVRGRIVTEKS